MTQNIKYIVTVEFGRQNDTVAFLDMLRYEGATVVEWRDSTDLPGQFDVTLSAPGASHARARWQSFGLHPKYPH